MTPPAWCVFLRQDDYQGRFEPLPPLIRCAIAPLRDANAQRKGAGRAVAGVMNAKPRWGPFPFLALHSTHPLKIMRGRMPPAPPSKPLPLFSQPADSPYRDETAGWQGAGRAEGAGCRQPLSFLSAGALIWRGELGRRRAGVSTPPPLLRPLGFRCARAGVSNSPATRAPRACAWNWP